MTSKNIYTHKDLIIWNHCKLINPLTGRKIKENGKTYNKIKKKYLIFYPSRLDPLHSVDDKDPISLNVFWILENSKKKLVYSNPEDLIVYNEISGLCRCFERSSLEQLKAYNILSHPITGEKIPSEIMNNINNIKLDIKKSINDLAFEVFQLFTKNSIFINHQYFIDLCHVKLQKLYYETREFYKNNITYEDRILIDNNDNIFNLDTFVYNTKTIKEAQEYYLLNIKKILEYDDDKLKYMLNYIILGALSVVIPEIKKNYSDFLFNFNI